MIKKQLLEWKKNKILWEYVLPNWHIIVGNINDFKTEIDENYLKKFNLTINQIKKWLKAFSKHTPYLYSWFFIVEDYENQNQWESKLILKDIHTWAKYTTKCKEIFKVIKWWNKEVWNKLSIKNWILYIEANVYFTSWSRYLKINFMDNKIKEQIDKK